MVPVGYWEHHCKSRDIALNPTLYNPRPHNLNPKPYVVTILVGTWEQQRKCTGTALNPTLYNPRPYSLNPIPCVVTIPVEAWEHRHRHKGSWGQKRRRLPPWLPLSAVPAHEWVIASGHRDPYLQEITITTIIIIIIVTTIMMTTTILVIISILTKVS